MRIMCSSEVYGEFISGSMTFGMVTLLTENRVLEALYIADELVSVRGYSAKVESCEMNHVKVVRPGKATQYLELGSRVMWLDAATKYTN